MKARDQAYLQALSKARQDLRSLDPLVTSYRSGVESQSAREAGTLSVPFFGQWFEVDVSTGAVRLQTTGEEPPITTQLLILHYLITADGSPMADHWISFREIPGAMGYDPAFVGRTSTRLVSAYGKDLDGFVRACESLGGVRLEFGDASYMFTHFPRLRTAVILHLGDEEFPPEVTVLYDGAASSYLPVEDLAVLGGMLCSQLIAAGTGH